MIEGTVQQYTILLQDCLAAVSKPILELSNLVSSERKVIETTFQTVLNKQMSVIMEETDREDEQSHCKDTAIKRKFNFQVSQLYEAKNEFENIVNFYHKQLKEFAKLADSQEKKIKKLTFEARERERQSMNNSRRRLSHSRSPAKPEKKDEEQELRVRPAPSPFREERQCGNCPLLTQRVQALQKESRNWKSLSIKIEDFKKKINSYELEIKTKNIQIDDLKSKIAENESKYKSEKEQDQKKRLMKDNTTLRGEKVLLSNQVAAHKRQLAEKTSVNAALESQVSRLRMEVQNLSTSLKWHSTNLSELRVGVTKERNQQWKSFSTKMEYLVKINRKLNEAINEQQENLIMFNQKCKKIEEASTRENEKKQKKIGDLEAILEDKNETIIRLKTGGKGEKVDRGGGYHADMVKVLNKRLAERQQRVRVLEDALAVSPKLQ